VCETKEEAADGQPSGICACQREIADRGQDNGDEDLASESGREGEPEDTHELDQLIFENEMIGSEWTRTNRIGAAGVGKKGYESRHEAEESEMSKERAFERH
jgi:hypothetical protein